MVNARIFRAFSRPAPLVLALSLSLSGCPPSIAQSQGAGSSTSASPVAALRPAAQSRRIAEGASLTPQLQLTGHIPGWVTPARQTANPIELSQPIHISFILRRDPAVETALDQLLADQQNPGSPLYHQWLTPEQMGALFGPTQSDLDAITSWATSQGLTVASVQPNRVIVELTGSIASVANAFHTTFAYFNAGDKPRLSATTEPSIPAAFGAVIQSIHGLTETHNEPQLRSSLQKLPNAGPQPQVTLTDGTHLMLPNDFAAIYDIASIYSSGNAGATIVINGVSTPQHVAIIGRSRVAASDISSFENYAGLANIQPSVVLAGTDPGTSNASDQEEATLDVDRVIGTAPGAKADLVIAADTNTEDGVDLAIAYNINTLRDPIMTISFGSCEAGVGLSYTDFLDSEFQTAAGEGITTFVSSGDSGAAGCEEGGTTPLSSASASVNALCSSSYVTCVGGTEFNDTANPSAYWSSNNGAGYVSALSYIPEGAWNEPTTVNAQGQTIYELSSTGGGASIYIAKPSWQTGTGVPADGQRDQPDIALSSAIHDGYLGCFAAGGADCTTYIEIFGGTSAAAPGMAGIAALLNTRLGGAQGNLNPLLYSLAATAPSDFHDATIATSGVASCSISTPSMCNNSTPGPNSLTGGLAGFALTAGYDQATGLGSLDVAKFLASAVGTTAATSLAVTTVTPNPVPVNQSVTLTATLIPGTSTSTPTGTVQFYSNGTVIGSAVTISNNSASLSHTFTTGGTYAITALYSGDIHFAISIAAAVSLVVNAPAFTITPATTTYTLPSGATSGNTDVFTVNSINGFAGAVGLSCVVNPAGGNATGSCSVTPASVTLTAGGTSNGTLTINTTAGTSGVIHVLVIGDNGTTTVFSPTIVVNLTAPGFTLAASPASLPTSGILASGSAVTSTVTLTSVDGFVGNVSLICAAANLNGTGTVAGSCTVSPTSVTLTSGGTANTKVSIATAAGTSGVLTATITGSGTTANSTVSATASTTVTATVVNPGFLLTPATATLAVASGATTGNTTPVTVTSTNGFAGTVTVACTAKSTSGTAAGACTATPVTLTAGGTGTSTVTLTSTPGTSGVLSLSIAATSGATSATAPTPVITATLTASSFTLTPGSTTLSFTSGATTGNTDTITATSVSGFSGPVVLTCFISTGSAAFPPACSAAPASITLSAGGTAASVISISSATAQDIIATQRAQLDRRWTIGSGAFFAMLLFIPSLRRRHLRSLATLALMAFGFAALSGCGSGQAAASIPKSSAGSYSVTITGTGTTTGGSISTTTTATFPLTIN